MMIRRLSAAGLIFVCAAAVHAAPVVSTERFTKELPAYLGGSFSLDNPYGDIEIVGTDDTKIVLTADKTITGRDKAAIEEGSDQTQLVVGGNSRTRVVRTIVPAIHSGLWAYSVRYAVSVPRTMHLSITSNGASRVHISGMRGNVYVKSFQGVVTLERLTGTCTVEGTNSSIVYLAPERGMNDAVLSTINGDIQVRAPGGTRFRWEAETFKGDLKTSFPVRGAFMGSRFRGSINGEGGPLVSTTSFNGTVNLLQNGSTVPAKSVRPLRAEPDASGFRTVEMRPLEVLVVQSFLSYMTNLGDIIVGEVHGNADVMTGAGEVQLGSVFGDCRAVSKGGPLRLGQITGMLTARTEAGDVQVESARKGGTIITGGGTIRLAYTGGETTLKSGGGDIFVRQAGGEINAETQSGDITISVDIDSKSERLTAKTAKGNIIINVPATFGADIDATVITSDPAMNNIVSELDGLQFRREQIGGKTKIRATGKVNGGGERLELYAEDGGIQINTHSGPPTP